MAVIKYLPYFMWMVVFLIVDIMSYDPLIQSYRMFGFTLDILGAIIVLLFLTFGLPGIAVAVEYANQEREQ